MLTIQPSISSTSSACSAWPRPSASSSLRRGRDGDPSGMAGSPARPGDDLSPRQETRRPPALCQAAPAGARRGCRLPRRPRPRSCAVPEARRRRLDRSARQSGHLRPDRRRQELACLRARPQGLPRQSLRPLSARPQAVRRSGARPRRRPLCPHQSRARRRPAAHPRRLGARALDAQARHDLWKSSRNATAADRPSSPANCPSTNGTPSSATDLCRRHPRPPRPQRSPPQSVRRQPAPHTLQTGRES